VEVFHDLSPRAISKKSEKGEISILVGLVNPTILLQFRFELLLPIAERPNSVNAEYESLFMGQFALQWAKNGEQPIIVATTM
jgi:hypothetical protein